MNDLKVAKQIQERLTRIFIEESCSDHREGYFDSKTGQEVNLSKQNIALIELEILHNLFESQGIPILDGRELCTSQEWVTELLWKNTSPSFFSIREKKYYAIQESVLNPIGTTLFKETEASEVQPEPFADSLQSAIEELRWYPFGDSGGEEYLTPGGSERGNHETYQAVANLLKSIPDSEPDRKGTPNFPEEGGKLWYRILRESQKAKSGYKDDELDQWSNELADWLEGRYGTGEGSTDTVEGVAEKAAPEKEPEWSQSISQKNFEQYFGKSESWAKRFVTNNPTARKGQKRAWKYDLNQLPLECREHYLSRNSS